MNNGKKYCGICKEELIEKINWNLSHKKVHRYICKICYNNKQTNNRRKKGIPERIWANGKCRICHVILTNQNLSKSNNDKHDYICKDCEKSRLNEWRKYHPEKIEASRIRNKDKERDRMREYVRKNIINTTDERGNPIRIKTSKRPHTLTCEMCHNSTKQSQYHHWDDEHPEWGIWVCCICHMFCEGIENGLTFEQYSTLKKKVESGEM